MNVDSPLQVVNGAALDFCCRVEKEREGSYHTMAEYRERRRGRKIREECFLRNGRWLLQKLITTFNGKSNPMRSFSELQLLEATSNYSSSLMFCQRDIHCKWYRGCLEGRLICVRRFEKECSHPSSLFERVILDIAIGAQMGGHKNALKLLGCCFETSPPIPVYEFPVSNAPLSDRVLQGSINDYQSQALPWKNRLRIGVEIANVVSYLHLAFPTPIVHRDINLGNFFLGEDCSVKLCSFFLAVPLPKGETHVVDVVAASVGYIAPEYGRTGMVTEKIDVYNFGMLLFMLLTGLRYFDGDSNISIPAYLKKHVDKEDLNKVVDPNIIALGVEMDEWHQIKQVLGLALLCTSESAERRPAMLDVAKHLKQIQRGEVIHVASNHGESSSSGITLLDAGVQLHSQENLNSNSFRDSPNLIDSPDFQEPR